MRLLSSDHITLRPLEPGDVDMILAWENDTATWLTSSTMAPYSRRMIEDYINSYRADIYGERQLCLMITLNRGMKPAGLIDLYDYDPANRRAMVGIYVDTAMRVNHVGHDALELLAAYARHHVGMHQLAALIAGDNAASQALFRSAGYSESARLRDWFVRRDGYSDGLIYRLQL